MKLAWMLGACLGLVGLAQSAIAQTANIKGPYVWVGYGTTRNSTECFSRVMTPNFERGSLPVIRHFWSNQTGNCYGLEMVGSPLRWGEVGRNVGICACPYHVTDDNRICGLLSAYVRTNGAEPACYTGDIYRTRY